MSQSSRIAMIGLGIEADTPAMDIQPSLSDGIHLRWAFRREEGFPWWGYFLFRRPSGKNRKVCISRELRDRKPGELPSTVLQLGVGQFSSSRSIRLSDDFPGSAVLEIDLAGDREWMRFTPPLGDTASSVDVRIGFRDVRDERRDCVDLRSIVTATRENPVRLKSLMIEVTRSTAENQRSIRPALRRQDERIVGGLDAGSESVIHLDHPADEVAIALTHVGPGVDATAFDARNEVVATARIGADETEAVHELVLRSERAAIARVELMMTQGRTALLQICHGWKRGGKRALRLVGSYQGVPMATQIVSGAPGEIASASLLADSIDEIAFLPYEAKVLPDAALVELCYVSAARNSRQGWEPVPDCKQPITLPVYHPDYPATGNSSVDLSSAESLALPRIGYGDGAPYAGAPFSDLHETLLKLVNGGPGGPAMADSSRASQIPADPQPGAPAVPSLSAFHPLDMVLIASVHPAAAQMLGLYWNDRTAHPGQLYDYLLISDSNGAGGADPMKALGNWLGGGPGYEGYIVWNKRVAPAPALPSPQGQKAFSLPLGAVISRMGLDQQSVDAAGLVGLRWSLSLSAGVLLPDSAVVYHLWREELGNDDTPKASSGLGDWLTKDAPVLVAQPITNPFATPQRPPDWPDFPMHRIDRVRGEGWYGYRVSGMDLFGRISPPGAPFAWHQWAPSPDPQPWYYQLPPSDAVVHPEAVRVLDKTGPPAPAGVEAVALDPQDPYVTADASYLAWRAGLPQALRDTLVGLRVSWRWTASQIRQAPGTQEFRLYYNAGGSLPVPNARTAANWAERVHVVPFADAAAVAANGDRTYRVLLPVQGGAVFAAGVPLTPTLANPVVFAHVGVSAADGAPHSPDDTKWAAGAWGDRPGNESLLGVPAKIYRVRRERPEPPVPPPDAERVYATPADYHSHSFYTYRWAPAAHLKTHVLRAMDSSVFAIDRSHRPRPALGPNAVGVFPNAATEPRWDALKRGQIANDLNGLNNFPPTLAGEAAARAAYRALSNDGLRILAGLSGNEAAFSQITVHPLDPADPANSNRIGPDNPTGYAVDPGLRIFVDTLDGRSTNRYFYRAAYVDGAHNRSALSLSGPPIWLPNVVPPRAPVLTAIIGGERRITLSWASNREPDLAAYRVYRTAEATAARDLRAMSLVQTIAVAAGEPEARPASVSWIDNPVPGLSNRWYVITAVDEADNESAPSRIALGRAYDESLPVSPALAANWTAAVLPAAARVVWSSEDETRIERRELQSVQWDPVGEWRPPGAHDETIPLDASLSWRLRLRVRKPTGALAIGAAVPLNHL